MSKAASQLSNGYDRSRPLLFMHVPKSAGQSFGAALALTIKARNVASGFDRCLFGGFNAFDEIDPTARSTIFLDEHDHATAADLVAAHMSLWTLSARFPFGQTVTVVREPRSRILSLWLYWRALGEDDLKPWGEKWSSYIRKSRLPLADFLQQPEIACQTDNQLCRMLLWPDSRIPASSFIDAEDDRSLSDDAWSKLQAMDLAVINEDPDMTRKVSAWIGSPFKLGLLNGAGPATSERVTALEEELTQPAVELLEMRSRLDQTLWRRLAEATMSLPEAQTAANRLLRQTIARHRDAHAGREPEPPLRDSTRL